ncbi:5-hydroxytryptamine receptor 1B-like [Bolinopsis microptera]|uniref:5-hydroxytryptamine receptor 1B-like n=1 Tax=Bolinopsis microptera TaxID=2820187 RepID=UPI003078B29A
MNVAEIFTRRGDVCISAVLAVLIILSMCLNIYTLRNIWREWKPTHFMNPSLRIVFNTSVSDFLYTIFPMIASLVSVANYRYMGSGWLSEIACNVTGFVFNVTLRHVVLSIAGLSLIRLLAITRPMHFKRLVQGTLVSRYMIVMWILPILVSIVPFFKGARYVYSQYIGLCTWSVHELLPDGKLIVWGHVFMVIIPLMIPGALILALYFAIVVEMIKLRHKRKHLQKGWNKISKPYLTSDQSLGLKSMDTAKPCDVLGSTLTINGKTMIGDGPPCLVSRSKTDVTRSRRLTQATYTTLTVMTAFLLSYLPYWLVCIEFLCKYVRYYYLNEQMTSTFDILFFKEIEMKDFSLLVMASYTTILVNASINPMIFIISLLRKSKGDMDLENRQEPDQVNCNIDLTRKSVKPCRSTEEQKFSNVD